MISRRDFLTASGAMAGAALLSPMEGIQAATKINTSSSNRKMKVALIGTGSRGCRMWGRDLVQNYSGQLEFVGLCDSNPGRLEVGKKYIGANCPTFSAMM